MRFCFLSLSTLSEGVLCIWRNRDSQSACLTTHFSRKSGSLVEAGGSFGVIVKVLKAAWATSTGTEAELSVLAECGKLFDISETWDSCFCSTIVAKDMFFFIPYIPYRLLCTFCVKLSMGGGKSWLPSAAGAPLLAVVIWVAEGDYVSRKDAVGYCSPEPPSEFLDSSLWSSRSNASRLSLFKHVYFS